MESKAVSELKFVKLLRQEGSSSLTIGSSTQDVVFEIPASCVNMSESLLKFDIKAPAPADTDFGTVMWRDRVAISRVRLETRQGAILADINHCAEYQKIACRAETSHDKFMTNADDAGGLLCPMFRKPTDDAKVDQNSQTQAVNSVTLNYDTNFQYNNMYPDSAGIANGTGRQVFPTYNREPTVMQVRLTGVANEISWGVKLGELLPNSVFSLDKSIPVPEVLVLRLTLGDKDQWGFEAKSANLSLFDVSLQTGAAPQAFTASHAITNLALYVATEQNMVLKNMLLSQAMTEEGLNIAIGYVHGYKSSLGTGTVNQSLRFSSGHGQTLTKIYHGIMDSSTLNGRNDSKATGKITSFRTLLNDMNRQEYELTVANNEDYDYLREYLLGSTQARVSTYHTNWSWIESFVGNNKNVSDSGALVGLPLGDREQKWSIYLNMASAHPHFSFACCQKLLRISNAGVQVM